MSITHDVLNWTYYPLRHAYRNQDQAHQAVDLVLVIIAPVVVYYLIQVIRWGSRLIRWLLALRPCQHDHCNSRTADRADGSHDGCSANEPCCAKCTLQHRLDEYPATVCSFDGTPMAVTTCGRSQLIACCTKCGSTTQEPGVLDAILHEVRYQNAPIGSGFIENVLK